VPPRGLRCTCVAECRRVSVEQEEVDQAGEVVVMMLVLVMVVLVVLVLVIVVLVMMMVVLVMVVRCV
jgi:hypothetical protein